MTRHTPKSNRTDTHFPYTTLFRSPQTSVEIIRIILVEPALHQPGDRDEGAGDARAEALVLVELHMVGEHLRGLDVGGRGGGGPEARAFECCARTQSDFDVVDAR